MDLKAIIAASGKAKPSRADEEWQQLTNSYLNQSRTQTLNQLKRDGVGLKTNTTPIDLGGLLKQVIDRASTVYNRPPARWLVRNRKRLEETDAQHVAMVEAFKASNYDAVWRMVDRYRSLAGQAILRFYPSDARKAVSVSVFFPQQVHRVVDPSCADLMDHDQAFALELSGGCFEVWTRDSQNAWVMTYTDKDGKPLADARQPFITSGGLCPYAELPVQQCYVQFPAGMPWIPPRQDRMAWINALNSCANDTLALSILQAHSTIVYAKNAETHHLADIDGPGVVHEISADEKIEAISPSPALNELIAVTAQFGRLFSTAESLPGNELDPNRVPQTGAALKTQLQALIDLREGQVALAAPDEQSAFRRYRAVHNVHAATWGVPTFDDALTLDLEVPDLETPTTATEEGNLAARQLALGTASLIDLIQRENNCTREDAIKRFHRIEADNFVYPPRIAPGSEQSGPRMSDVDASPGPTAPDRAPDAALAGKASVVDSIKASAATSDPKGEDKREVSALGASKLGASKPPQIADEALQDSALNGAQVTSLIEVLDKVAIGGLPRETGIQILIRAFQMTDAEADKLFGPVGKGFKPTVIEGGKA